MSDQQREHTSQSHLRVPPGQQAPSDQRAPRQRNVPEHQRAPWHQRGRWLALVVAAVGSLVAVTILTMLLAPALSSSWQAEIADGQRPFAIKTDSTTSATVTPEAGWSVQPSGDGLLLRSPDRLLVVEVLPTDEVTLVAKDAFKETLSSGVELRHITEQGYFSGELIGENSTLQIEAHVESRFDLDRSNTKRTLADYRPALSALLESVRVP